MKRSKRIRQFIFAVLMIFIALDLTSCSNNITGTEPNAETEPTLKVCERVMISDNIQIVEYRLSSLNATILNDLDGLQYESITAEYIELNITDSTLLIDSNIIDCKNHIISWIETE
jgi:hypothetical protein